MSSTNQYERTLQNKLAKQEQALWQSSGRNHSLLISCYPVLLRPPCSFAWHTSGQYGTGCWSRCPSRRSVPYPLLRSRGSVEAVIPARTMSVPFGPLPKAIATPPRVALSQRATFRQGRVLPWYDHVPDPASRSAAAWMSWRWNRRSPATRTGGFPKTCHWWVTAAESFIVFPRTSRQNGKRVTISPSTSSRMTCPPNSMVERVMVKFENCYRRSQPLYHLVTETPPNVSCLRIILEVDSQSV